MSTCNATGKALQAYRVNKVPPHMADLHPTLLSAAVALPLEIEVEVKYSALKRAFEALLVRVFPLLVYDTKG